MKIEIYNAKRQALLDEAQKLLDESKMDEFDAKTKEIEALDAQQETEAKAQANFNALAGKQTASPMAAGTVPMDNRTGAEDLYDSAEYKQAFMAYVLSGKEIPAKFVNENQSTTTSDAGAVIPTSTIQKIYEKMEQIGTILNEVTRTNIKAGLTVPASTSKPTASWVAEGAGSYTVKKTVSSVTFAYHKLRCVISMSYEMANISYPFFEKTLVQNIADAMVKAKEKGIIAGTGSTYHQPKGILTETAAKDIEITEGQHISYANLCEAEGAEVEEGAVWCMTKKTYMGEIAGMVDENGQPIARVNYGMGGKPEYTIFGRRVLLADTSYMDTFATSVTADSIVAFLFNFKDYLFNSAVGMTTKRYTDNSTDDECIKAIELCDGKAVLTHSLVTLTVKNG